MNFVEPIRDRKKIAQIKNLLRGEGRFRDRLLFVVGINTASRISDLLDLQVEHFLDDHQHTKRRFWSKEQKRGKGDMELKLKNGTAHYHVYGEGIPLLTLGGRTTDYRFMMGLMEPLFQERPGWQRIYLDPPGHGRTRVDKSVDSYDRVLDFIIDFADTLLEGRSFAIAGQSLGSDFAMGVVHKRPEQVDGCCLIASGGVWWDYRSRSLPLPDHVVLEGDSDFVAGIKTEHEWLANLVVTQSKRGLENLYDDWLSAGYRLYDAKLWDLIKENSPRGLFSFDVNKLAEPFERPTLILTGRQDSMDGYEIPWDTFNMFPRATLAVLDKAGHLVGWAEQESLSKTLIVEWLNRVEADIQARSLST